MQETLQIGTDELTFRVTGEQTDGALLAVDVRLPAGGGPPVLHRHTPLEVYRVDRGELAIYVKEADGAVQRIAAGPGAVVHIPAGRAHTVRNESGAEATAYVVFAPGTEIERFMRAAGALDELGPEDVLALAERHGIEMTSPVPAG